MHATASPSTPLVDDLYDSELLEFDHTDAGKTDRRRVLMPTGRDSNAKRARYRAMASYRKRNGSNPGRRRDCRRGAARRVCMN